LGSSATGSAFEKQCKELERLQGQIADANDTFDDQDDITTRARTRRGKSATKNLSQKIKDLMTALKEKVAEHQLSIEKMLLERREFEFIP
jgi:hypothetical protein